MLFRSVCTYCIAPPSNAKPLDPNSILGPPNPVGHSVTTMCNNGHMLWFSTFSYLSGIYECNKCLSHKNCEDGRWFCVKCEYDICPDCRPRPVDIEKYTKTCFNGHCLIQLAQNLNDQNGFYRCSFCRKAKDANENRWWCPICNYDICTTCADLDIDDVEWPEALEPEERWCKGNTHEFLKSRDTEDFVCVNEDREVDRKSVV